MNHGGLKHLDLFSGIGGFAIAAEQVWPDIKHTFCDIDPFARKILFKHWPGTKVYEDIRAIQSVEPVYLLTGGFPCQPFSSAGKRKGTEDDRYLWPEMLRVIRASSPRWVIGENVSGLLTWNGGMVLDQVCADLESEGYEVWPFVLPACAVGAPHRRDRIWIVAHSNRERLPQRQNGRGCKKSKPESEQQLARLLPTSFWNDISKPDPYRMVDGVSKQTHRNHALGNAIVPQVAKQIMLGIQLADAK